MSHFKIWKKGTIYWWNIKFNFDQEYLDWYQSPEKWFNKIMSSSVNGAFFSKF
jgi:hypothetical protein